MQVFFDLSNNKVIIKDGDTGRQGTFTYDEWSAGVNVLKGDDVWRADVERMFDDQVAKTMLDTMELQAQTAVERGGEGANRAN